MKQKLLLFVVLSVMLSACVPSLNSSGTPQDQYIKGAFAPGFPSIPLYKNSKVIESYGFNKQYGSASVTKDDVSKVVQFFSDSLKQLGWDYSIVQNSPDNYEFKITNAGQQGSIIVNKTADGLTTGITIAVAPR